MIKFLMAFGALTLFIGIILEYVYRSAPETRWKAVKYLLITSSVCGMSAIIMFFFVQLF